MTRRPLVLAGIALALAATGLAALGPALRHLDQARAERIALDRVRLLPAAPIPLLASPGEVQPAAGPAQAAAILTRLLRDTALREGALVEGIAPVATADPSLAGRHVRLSGSVRAVLRVAEAIESREPTIRFARWRLDGMGGAGDTVRLDADAVMPWARAR